ncbi:MAG: hypothetical protein AB4206_10675 [Xenococcaceae cyanobacterium]|nr:hypothetical protein [Cyanobacteriota bacterium]
MKLVFEIPDEALLDFGKEAIEREIQDSLKWLHLRRDLTKLAKSLKATWQESDYQQELSAIRAEAWQEYKQNLEL